MARTNRDLFSPLSKRLAPRVPPVKAAPGCRAGLEPGNAATCRQTYGNDHDAVVQEAKPNEGQRIVQQHCGTGTNISTREDLSKVK